MAVTRYDGGRTGFFQDAASRSTVPTYATVSGEQKGGAFNPMALASMFGGGGPTGAAGMTGSLVGSTPAVTSGLGGLGTIGTSVPVGTTAAAGAGMDPMTMMALASLGAQLGGSVMSGIGQGKMSDAQIRAQQEMQAKQIGLSRDQMGLQATQMDPLAQQKSRQQQALLAALLPNARNVSVSSNVPGMNQFMPNISGGMRLPEGGLSPETLAFFGGPQRASAEASFFAANSPFAAPPALSSMGYSQGDIAQAGASGGSPQLTNGQSPIVPYNMGTGQISRPATSDIAGRAQARDSRNAAMLSALR